MLHTKAQVHWPFGSREVDLKKAFYHIWAWRPSWSCDQDHFNILFHPIIKNHHMKFEFNVVSEVFENVDERLKQESLVYY